MHSQAEALPQDRAGEARRERGPETPAGSEGCPAQGGTQGWGRDAGALPLCFRKQVTEQL